ncbi:MAG: hypothetical protein IJJ30_07475 [Erysipelotrichaceae bacterium]|nr:hypothetical protein [Erysipelotrichaceae bacterium]
MKLNSFFKNAPDIEIQQLSCDSRMPMIDAIFFCIRGVRYNGHDFVKEAIKNGAKVIIYSEDIDTSYPVIFIRVNDTLDTLNHIAAAFYKNPSKEMENIIIGGNDYRSLTAFTIKKIIDSFDRPCGYIGSMGIYYKDIERLSKAPTLTIIENQRILSAMKNAGVLSCCYEMNLSGIELKKLAGVVPESFIYVGTDTDDWEFTDSETDYCLNYQNYINSLPETCDVILNGDDPAIRTGNITHDCMTFGFGAGNDYQARDVKIYPDHTTFLLRYGEEEFEVTTHLLGRNCVYPILAIIACLTQRGYPLDFVLKNLNGFTFPQGYLQNISLGQSFRVIVDQAKNSGALRDLLEYAKETTDSYHRIIAVYGFNQKSEKSFRQKAIQLLNKYCDMLVLTENDSGDRDPNELNKMFLSNDSIPHVLIEKREEAIFSALMLANSADCVLLLGKGNEKYINRSLGNESYAGDSDLAKKYLQQLMNN